MSAETGRVGVEERTGYIGRLDLEVGNGLVGMRKHVDEGDGTAVKDVCSGPGLGCERRSSSVRG